MAKALSCLAALTAVVIVTACSSSPGTGSGRVSSPRPALSRTTASACHAPHIATPGWFPNHLPLPKGAFSSRKLESTPGFHHAAFVVPVAMPAFERFVRDRWASAGYVLGRMAVGRDHFSGSFVKLPARGTFLVQPRCGGRESVLFLSYGAASPTPSSP